MMIKIRRRRICYLLNK